MNLSHDLGPSAQRFKPHRNLGKFLLAGVGGVLGLAAPLCAQTLPATLTVNAGTTVTSFVPIHVFGVNTAYWVPGTANDAVSARVMGAGNYFLRYPGGSSSDDYHWNSTGSFDANHYWVPNGATYTAGFQGCEIYRGTTSQSYGYASNLDDGNNATTWMSNADTDYPNHQWVYMDLGATNTAVNSVTIVWGNPYATTLTVQYDNVGSPLNSATEGIWANTTAMNVAGTGGTQGVAFTSVNTRYLRILMTASSAGANGAYAIAELYVYNGATQVSKNSATQANQSTMVVSSTDPASANTVGSCTNYHANYYQTTFPGSLDFANYMTEVQSFSPQAIPLITVNFGTGTPSEAASWVHYANAVKGYGIHFWQIGNETNGVWETGGPMNANDYGRRFMEYYAAMQAEASSDGVPITIVGPVPGSPNPSSNAYDGNTYIQDFLLRLYNNPGGNAVSEVGGIDFHWYPGVPANGFPAGFSTPAQLSNFAVTLSGWLSAVGLSKNNMPIIMSEYNCNAGTPNVTVQLSNGLWLADWLGQFITGFGPTGYSNLWDVINGGNDHNTATGGDLGYLDNSAPYQSHATYWAMQMMATDWAIQGDSNTHELVNSASSAATLATYADARPDGVLSLMVVNTDPTDSYATTLNLNGFVPNPTANSWTFNTTNYAWQTTTTPYNANPDTAPTTATLTGVAPSFSVTFSPYSITVLQFTNSGQPTSTPTSSPSPTATRTGTNTPSATSTATPSSTPTFSPTPTLTRTPTDSPTPTLTPSPTNSPTASPTNTACMDGSGNTCTFTETSTLSPTSTPTSTATVTPTATETFSPTDSETPTATSTPTVSPTATDSPVATDSMTPTASPTATASASPTSTPTVTATSTPSGTATSTPPWTATPFNAGIPFPNPVTDGSPLQFNYLVPSTEDQVRVKIFTTAFRKIYEDDGLATTAGSHLYVLDWGKAGLNVANGLYYVVVEQETSGQTSRQVMKLLVER